MTNLTYTSEQQLINDAAQMLLINHLHWSNSNEGMPSDDRDGVMCEVKEAYLSYTFPNIEEWEALSSLEQRIEIDEAVCIFRQAAILADRKWEAAMLLIGIEQQ